MDETRTEKVETTTEERTEPRPTETTIETKTETTKPAESGDAEADS